MRKIILIVARGITRKTLAIFGLGSTCFFIAACYGTPQADYEQMPVRKTAVTGKVNLQGNMPGANAVVRLITNGDTLYTLADQKGCYTFNNIDPCQGSYTLLADAGEQTGSAVIQFDGSVSDEKFHVADINVK